MKNIFLVYFLLISLFLFNPIYQPVTALPDPVPQLSTSIHYPDTCNPEFWVTFDIANLGTTSHADSYLSITLSSHLEFVSWRTTPNIPDMMIRFFENGNPALNISGLYIGRNNKIIEVYNHSFKHNESITVTMFFENTIYQSDQEWIKCRLVMYPENTTFPTSQLVQDPVDSIIKDQQGYSVYQFGVAPNKRVYPIDSEVEVIPEFPSWIIGPLFLIAPIIVLHNRKRIPNSVN